MDLRELHGAQVQRHPWETARVKAVADILGAPLREGITVLDVGCGDGYLSRTLFSGLARKKVTAVDINLTGERIRQLQSAAGGFRYLTRLPARGSGFELALLLDVLEHVEDDRQFLTQIAEQHVAAGGRVLLTVPAFQQLYSSHDRFLGHYRRYRLKEVEQLAQGAGLEVVASGYLFGCLLLPKLLLYKFLEPENTEGIGCWSAGAEITFLVGSLLRLENSLMIRLARRGVKPPGLSAWALCEKRSAAAFLRG